MGTVKVSSKSKVDSNLCGLAALDDTGVRRFFGHIFAPYFKCMYLFFKGVVIKVDVEDFYITYLRMVEGTNFADRFSKG